MGRGVGGQLSTLLASGPEIPVLLTGHCSSPPWGPCQPLQGANFLVADPLTQAGLIWPGVAPRNPKMSGTDPTMSPLLDTAVRNMPRTHWEESSVSAGAQAIHSQKSVLWQQSVLWLH